ncbi:hypothetical protein [Streptomyces flaveus]|uniref:Secreted protein n=1 Tax=Streptomyces flaveus TaxID=66370 RepID=A0A917RN27_9ACTN|nr:hypothetical protein [Streptomyces flaveus]GGL15572.1 hypothetical protein GCM10010094_90590 [Streptomyces flaveus]
MTISTKLAAATGAALTAGLLMAAPASAGSTGTTAACPATLSPETDGGAASWSIECVGSKVYIDGWVRDTDADGKCAWIKAFGSFTDGSGRKDAKACPKNTTTRFSWVANGTEIRAYLYVA